MMFLVLRLTAPEKSALQYASFERNASDAAWQLAAWEQVQPLMRQARHILVLIPSREVLLTQTTINTRNQRQLLQALPFALEEQLMTDPETQHYVWHELDKETGLGQVAVMEHRRLQQWLDFLHHNGIAPYAILPDLAAIPFSENTTTAWLQTDGIWIRQGALSGYCAPANSWPLLLKQWLKNGTEEQPWQLRILEGSPRPTPVATLGLQLDADAQALVLRRSDWEAALPLNLMKGFRSQAFSQVTELLAKWRSVAIAAVLTAVVAGAVQFLEMRHLQHEIDAITQANVAQFQSLFPKTTIDPALSLRSLMTSELKKQQSYTSTAVTPKSPLATLTKLAQVLPQQPITLQSLEWRQNKLTVRFTSDSTEAVAALEQVLTNAMQRDIAVSYQREAKKVVGEFTLALEQAG